MNWLRVLASRLRGLHGKKRLDEELEEELHVHLDMLTEENINRGMSPEDARYAARRSFGGIEQTKESFRDQRGLPLFDTLLQDIRFGLRILRKNPGFSFVAVLTLGLGIGANTAVFSVVNAVLLRPLPYSEPDRLVFIYDSSPGFGIEKFDLMGTEFLHLRDQSRSLELVSLYTSGTLTLTGAGEPERVSSGNASGDFFATLGVPMTLGRTFNSAEEAQGEGNVVIVSHNFWQRKLAGSPEVIGQGLTLDGRSYTVVGVLPQEFVSPPELQSEQPIELWVPPGYYLANPCCSHGLKVIARLREGNTLEGAQAETDAIIADVMKDYPYAYSDDGSSQTFVKPLSHEIVGDLSRPLWLLLTAVIAVLLIACANVANLLLARGEARQKEIALRAALGASRLRIIRQLLVESLLLSVLGGGLGLVLGALGLELLPSLGSGEIPRMQEIALDRWVLCFTLVTSIVTGLVFGLAPAFRAVQLDLQTTLKAGTRRPVSSQVRLRNYLVVAEVALSLLLLTGAGLLLRTFWAMRQVDTGFRAERVLTVRLFPPASIYPNDQKLAAFYEKVLERVQSLPGVNEAAVASGVPVGSMNGATVLQVEGRPVEMSKASLSEWRVVSAGYFRTLGVRLVRGRYLDDSDLERATPVAVINETTARSLWPQEDPLGRRIRLMDSPEERGKTVFLTVVGVVADAKNGSLIAAPSKEVFVSLRQREAAVAGMGFIGPMTLAVHTSMEPANLVNSIREEVWALDRNIPITEVRTMEQILETATVQPRFNMVLLGIFGCVALLLAAAGIYGVMSYTVTQQTREIGIRLALGAPRSHVLKLVVGRGMLLTAIGVGLGLGAALALTRLMASLLYGVSATDPATFVVIAVGLAAVALLACLLPARRAARVDPIVALRCE